MATFREFVHICTIYILLNQVTNHYAFSFFNFGQAQVRQKAPPQESNSHLNAALKPNEDINHLPSNSHQKSPSNLPVLHQNNELSLLHRQPRQDKFQISHYDKDPNSIHLNNHDPILNNPRPVNNLPVRHHQDNNEAKFENHNRQSFYHQQKPREYSQRVNDQFDFHHNEDFVNHARVFHAKRAHDDFDDEARAPRAKIPLDDFVNEARAPRAKRPYRDFVNEARASQAKRPYHDINQPIFNHYEHIGNPGMYHYMNNPSIRHNQPYQFHRVPQQVLRNNLHPRNDPIYQKDQKIHLNAAPFAGNQKSRIRSMRNQYPKSDIIYDQMGRIRQRGNFNPQNQQSGNRVRQSVNSAKQNIRHIHILQDAPHQRLRAHNPNIIYDQAGGIRQRGYFDPQNQQFGDRIRQRNVYEIQDDYEERQMNRKNDERVGYQSNWKGYRVRAEPMNQFPPRHEFQPIHQEAFDGNFKHQKQFDYITPLDDPIPREAIHNPANRIRMQRATFGGQKRTLGGEIPTFEGQKQSVKHFRYSRIRRYYTLSTASMTTWKKLNYTTRLMYTTPTTPTTRRYTDPRWGGSSRQTVLHTRMTESDEVGKDLFLSGSIEYKDDSFDKPPTAMVAYDSLMDSAKNGSTLGTAILAPVTTPTKPTPKTTKKASIELISLESSSEEKPSSSEAKEEESSSESENYGNEKLYGEYGYYKKYNNTPTPIVIDTYPNIREVPGFEEFNLTSAEVAFWEANASWIMDEYLSSNLTVISNYSEENLVRSFFLPENIESHHLDFYKWYYKLLTNPERLRIIYNKTVLEEPDYKNLSQYTPFAIPEDLQRYYMFINQMEIEIDREKQQQEYHMKNEREAEQNIDKILGVVTSARGKGVRPSAGESIKIPRLSRKDDPDVSQILEMIDNNQQSDSLMREDDSSDRFIDVSRYKRDVSKFEPD